MKCRKPNGTRISKINFIEVKFKKKTVARFFQFYFYFYLFLFFFSIFIKILLRTMKVDSVGTFSVILVKVATPPLPPKQSWILGGNDCIFGLNIARGKRATTGWAQSRSKKCHFCSVVRLDCRLRNCFWAMQGNRKWGGFLLCLDVTTFVLLNVFINIICPKYLCESIARKSEKSTSGCYLSGSKTPLLKLPNSAQE